MKKIEYKVVFPPIGSNNDSYIEYLNREYRENRWELVCVKTGNGHIFKRVVKKNVKKVKKASKKCSFDHVGDLSDFGNIGTRQIDRRDRLPWFER